jgi:hypothetical protein
MGEQTDYQTVTPRQGNENRGDENKTQRLSGQDVEDIEERSRLRAPIIYEIVRREGEEEMRRPLYLALVVRCSRGPVYQFLAARTGDSGATFIGWTLAAAREQLRLLGWVPDGGASASAAFYGKHHHGRAAGRDRIHAAEPWPSRPTMGRRLFRQHGGHSVRCVVLLVHPSADSRVARGHAGYQPPHDRKRLARDVLQEHSRWLLDRRDVWLIPSAADAQFHVITFTTYLIGIAGFNHIVAGSVEAFLLLTNGELGIWHMIAGFTVPVLLGNVIGGTALFALISYAQVMKEV